MKKKEKQNQKTKEKFFIFGQAKICPRKAVAFLAQ
jgi:hypothetical protein